MGVKNMATKEHIQATTSDQRAMSKWDMFATWIGANANNGTWYIGGVIAAVGLIKASTLLVVVGRPLLSG